MKRKGLNAMSALLKFLVPLAIFLLASHANVFTSLGLVAGNQVSVNYLIQLQQPKSNPTNESSHNLICEPTKQMDLDTELPNNLSPKKTQMTYSEPKQDADLPCKIIDSSYTQICWLCHTSEKSNGCQQLPHSENSDIWSQICGDPTNIFVFDKQLAAKSIVC
jgi:hypothetical protein